MTYDLVLIFSEYQMWYSNNVVCIHVIKTHAKKDIINYQGTIILLIIICCICILKQLWVGKLRVHSRVAQMYTCTHFRSRSANKKLNCNIVNEHCLKQKSANYQNVPMQGCKLHVLFSEFEPIHINPPCAGAGLLQCLTLVDIPTPQVVEHAVQLSYALHSPSTVYSLQQKLQLINRLLG